MALVPDVLPVTGAEIAAAAELMTKHPALDDAVHAATMRAHSIATIVSTDQGFDVVRGLRRVARQDAADL